MKHADSAFLYPEEDENDSLDAELEAKLSKQPPKIIMKHQEYRTVTVGPEDMLKNGKMV